MHKQSAALSKPKKQKNTVMNRAKQEHDLLMLLCYLRRSPKILQEVFNPYVKQLVEEYALTSSVGHLLEKLKSNVKGRNKMDRKHILLFQNFANLINRNEIIMKMVSIRPLLADKWAKGKGEPHLSYNDAAHPINLIRPKYYLTEKIAKQEGEVDIGMKCQNVPDNESLLYAEPRFYQKLNELVHFKSNKKFKGSILLLEYHGHAITGGRAYAVLNNSAVQIWQMSSHIFPFPFAMSQTSEDVLDDDNASIKSGHIDEPTFSRQYKFIAHKDKVTCACFSSDQFYLITGGVDRIVRLWCLRLKTMLAEYRSHSRTIWDVHFNPSGYYFLSGSADGLMILWKTDTAYSQRIFDHGSDVFKVSFAKYPDYAISAGDDCKIKVWHIVNAQVKYCLQLAKPIINFTLGHSGIFIVTIEQDGRVTLFNLFQGIMINSFYFYSKRIRQKCEGKVIIHDACLSEDERELVCVSNQHVVIYSMDVLESQRKINVFEKSSRAVDMERKVTPKEVIMVSNKMRVNFCGFRDYRLLVVGAARQ